MGSKTQTVQQQQQYTPNPLIAQYGGQALAAGAQAAQEPYSNMPIQPIAGFSPQQQQAFAETQAAQGMAQPYYQAAGNLIAANATPSQANINNYFGGAASGVMGELQNLYGQQQSQNTANLVNAAGGVGADRIAVGQGNLANQQALAAGQTLSGLYSQAVNQAMQGAQLGQAAGYGLANVGAGSQQAQLQGIQALLGTGGLQQQLAQAQLNAPYQWQVGAFQYPYQQAQFQAGLAGGLAPAFGGTTTGQTQYPGPSLFSQLLGLGIAGGSLAGGLGSMGYKPFSARGGVVDDNPFFAEEYQTGGTPLGDNPFASPLVPDIALHPGGGQGTGHINLAGPPQQQSPAQQAGGIGSLVKGLTSLSKPKDTGVDTGQDLTGGLDPIHARGGHVFAPHYQTGGALNKWVGPETLEANNFTQDESGEWRYAPMIGKGAFGVTPNQRVSEAFHTKANPFTLGMRDSDWLRLATGLVRKGVREHDRPPGYDDGGNVGSTFKGSGAGPSDSDIYSSNIEDRRDESYLSAFANQLKSGANAGSYIVNDMLLGNLPARTNSQLASAMGYNDIRGYDDGGDVDEGYQEGGDVPDFMRHPFDPLPSFGGAGPAPAPSGYLVGTGDGGFAIDDMPFHGETGSPVTQYGGTNRDIDTMIVDPEDLPAQDATPARLQRERTLEASNPFSPNYAGTDAPRIGGDVVPLSASNRALLPADVSAYSPTDSGAPPSPDHRVGFGEAMSKFAQSPWMAGLAAGLGIMGGTSPFALTNVGQGGLQGVKALEQQRQDTFKEEALRRQAAQQESMAAHQRAMEQIARQQYGRQLGMLQLESLKPFKIGMDESGRDIYGTRDPQTGKVVPIDVTGQPLAAQSPGKPQYNPKMQTASEDEGIIPTNATLTSQGPYDYRKDAPYIEKGMDVPEPAATAGKSSRSMQTDAEYYLQTSKLPPVSRGRSPVAIQQNEYRNAVQNYAGALAQSRGLSPEQTAEMWRTAPGMLRFILGPDGRSTVALGTAVRHLDTLRQLSDAWSSGDVQAINRLKAIVSREFGADAATNLQAAGRIIGPEIIKAIGVAGAGTQADRDAAGSAFSTAASPQQMLGAIQTTQKLLGGQLEGRQRQASNAGVSTERFKSLIGDRPFDILTGIDRGGGGTGTAASVALPDAARSKLEEGKVTKFNNGQKWMLKNGQPVQVQ